jgi:hypothetical protein
MPKQQRTAEDGNGTTSDCVRFGKKQATTTTAVKDKKVMEYILTVAMDANEID